MWALQKRWAAARASIGELLATVEHSTESPAAPFLAAKTATPNAFTNRLGGFAQSRPK